MAELKLIELQRRISRPEVGDGVIVWPWLLNSTQRRDVEHASRHERPFDEAHYTRVLDERNIHENLMCEACKGSGNMHWEKCANCPKADEFEIGEK
jgi:hypothetical protein